MEPQDLRLHIRIHASCGACRFAFYPGNCIVAICRTKSGVKAFSAFTFLSSSYCDASRDGWFCHYARCPRCATQGESVTLHADCWNLFKKECSIPSRIFALWTVACWRTPWRGLLPAVNCGSAVPSTLDLFIQKDALPNKPVPPELASQIWSLCPEKITWSRFQAVLSLSEMLSEHRDSRLLSAPLHHVDGWRRGEDAKLNPLIQNKPIIYITMDLVGIKQIERLSSVRDREIKQADDSFAAINVSDCPSDATTFFMFGLARVKFRSNPGALYVWNVPIPPPLGQCRFLPPSLPVSGRLHAVELAGCTGITFFMRGGTYAVHGHTRAAPSAERTYHRLERRRREPVAWVYVPLPQEDRLLSFGIRKPLAGKNYRFLFRFARAGEVVAGAYAGDQKWQYLMSSSTNPTLIHNAHEFSYATSMGIYPAARDESTTTTDLLQPSHNLVPVSDSGCFSWASLDKVHSVRIFEDQDTQFCAGILLTYEDGSQRALGQCRVGWDSYVECIRPYDLCFLAITLDRRTCVEVEATATDEAHDHEESGWECCTMDGILQCGFSKKHIKLAKLDSSPSE